MVLAVKNPSANARDIDLASIHVLGNSPGGENANPLQYSFLENPLDRGAMGSRLKPLSMHPHMHACRHLVSIGCHGGFTV